MMQLDKSTLEMMKNNLKTEFEYQMRKHQYMKEAPIEQILSELKEQGITLTEDDIITKYNELKDIEQVDNGFYKKFQRQWDNIERKGNWYDSDVQFSLVKRVIEKHFDTRLLADSWFIEDHMQYIENECPQDQIQQEYMQLIKQLIECAQFKNTHTLRDIIKYYDINEFLKYYIKRCHNRNSEFKSLMKKFYESFDDADQSMYKIK